MAVKGPNHQMRTRIRGLTVLFALIGFGLVGVRLLYMQVFNHDFYVQQATALQTRDTFITPNRGKIYDANMQVLAESAAVERITVDPKAVVDENKVKKGITAESQQQTLATILSETLAVDYDTVMEKIQKTNSQYEIIAQKVDKDVSKELDEKLEAADCTGVYSEPDTKRYYQHGAFLSAVLVYVGSDNNGAYGLESEYNDELAGTAGRLVRVQNAQNKDIMPETQQYIPATDGNSLVLTIDSDIQNYLEKHLETALADNPEARDGVSGIVMNVKTGEVLAMANLPDFDPNDAYKLTSDKYINELKKNVAKILKEENVKVEIPDAWYTEGGLDNLPEAIHDNSDLVDALGSARVNILMKTWRNPVIADNYEPGSTFKALVLAAALEEGVVSESDTFYCPGYYMVEGWPKPISCSKKAPGHGTQTLAEAVQNSCNPAFMQIGQRLGIEKFYEYFQAFGLTEPTNIDLNGEGVSTVWPLNTMTGVDLAVGSFGQRFTVTPIQMITAFAATINGGKLLQPYVVQTVTAADGTVVENTEPTVVRQVVSQETSDKCREILTSVVMAEKGTGKNARQAGYTIGGKTGTSETTVPGEVVVSFMGFAPADDPQILVLLAYNTPARSAEGSSIGTTGTWISGGNMGAPMAGKLIGEILDYLGVEKEYTADEAALADLQTPKVTGMTPADAEAALEKKGLDSRTVGEGETVTAQVPAAGSVIPGESTVILYLGGAEPEETGTVPDVTGMSFAAARSKLESAGFFMRAAGAATYLGSSSKAQGQSVAGGETAAIGTIVDVTFSTPQVEDGYLYDG